MGTQRGNGPLAGIMIAPFNLLASMSALPPKADIDQHGRDVRFVPKADSCTAAKNVVIRSSHRQP